MVLWEQLVAEAIQIYASARRGLTLHPLWWKKDRGLEGDPRVRHPFHCQKCAKSEKVV
jgi:hypothetical protein